MSSPDDRRTEKRLKYNWPVWFADDFNDSLCQGQMVDICSSGGAFTCYADRCPKLGQKLSARFSVPRFGEDNSFELENFIRDAYVSRVDEVSAFVRRVAVKFSDPLDFKPGEMTDDTEALAADDTLGFMGSAAHDAELEWMVGHQN